VKADGEAAAIKLGQAELQVGVRIGATISTRNYLSAQHLWTARHNAALCRQREVAIAGTRPIDVQHRSYATTAVLMSVAFLEATVNEVFEDATDDRHVGQRVERLEPRVRAMLASFWESVGNGRYSLLGKYQMALLLSGAGQFDKGAQPYQDAQLLIDFRNGLVHFRPDWHDSGTKRKFDSLGNRFHQSGLLSDEDGSDWLTVKALGASGALWALATAKAFADEWTSRLGIPKLYDRDLVNLDKEFSGD
jgi:hypothetical protein